LDETERSVDALLDYRFYQDNSWDRSVAYPHREHPMTPTEISIFKLYATDRSLS